MRIAVTGATGFVGRHLLERLVAGGHGIAAVSHRRPRPETASGAIDWHQASIDDEASLSAAFASCEAVVHLVGIIAETRHKTFDATVFQGTANVVAAAKKAGVKRLLYLSAMGTAADAPSRYHQSKYQAEESVRASGMEWVILRPSVIHGPGDGFISMLADMVRRTPLVPIIGDGRYRLQPVHIGDVTEAMAIALDSPRAAGQIIDLGGPEELEYRQILNIIMTTLGKRRGTMSLPVGLARFAAGFLERLVKPSPLTRDQITMMQMGNTGDITKMREVLGIEPRSFAPSLKTYLR